jgi:hypothetical protein
MTNWKNLEGNKCGLIEVLSRHLPGGTEENHKKTQDSQCPCQDSN